MATITEDYVSFEIAKLLKEKGFNEPCYGSYCRIFADDEGEDERVEFERWIEKSHNNSFVDEYFICSAPTIQMAMKWLREKHYCHIVIDYTFKADANLSEEYVSYCYSVENAKTYIQYIPNEWYSTYEQACEAAIKYCLKHLI